ncbi:hypothetical protein [Winogradskyella sp. MH6]|uniref:hypothetical protein n=1 Tax=Winogradskyella sp. MH6 TaxID=2929510 RepID=UPI001FB314DF|nr:hypothetical protein [Winogradskyella sp. MH6]
MKRLYNINKWLIIITLLLYLTFYFGFMAQIVLGIAQITMSILILFNYSKLSISLKKLFITYLILAISAISIYVIKLTIDKSDFSFFLLFTVATMLLALFHLYITYKIQQS